MTKIANVVFVGEAPGPSGAVGMDGHSGRRLALLLDVPASSLKEAAFLNLLQKWPGPSWRHHERGGKGSRFPTARARRAVPSLLRRIWILPKWHERTIVLLGRRVAEVIGGEVASAAFMKVRRKGVQVNGAWLPAVVVPHPSGVNRLWNDVDVVLEFRATMRRILK